MLRLFSDTYNKKRKKEGGGKEMMKKNKRIRRMGYQGKREKMNQNFEKSKKD